MFEGEEIQPKKHVKKCTQSRQKIKNAILSISVEPTTFIVMFTSVMYQLVVQNLYLEKACRVEMKYNQSICDAMTERNTSGYTRQQDAEVQKITSQMIGLRTFIQGSIPLIAVLFAGSWSDRHNRRKPLVIIPIIGEILCCVMIILNTIFFYELPLIYTTLGDSIPYAVVGGWSCFFNGIFSYVGSKAKDEDKTVKMGIITALQMSGSLLGTSVAGLLYKKFGFILFFSLCIVLLIIAFICAYFLLSDDINEIEDEKKIGIEGGKKFGVFQDIFSLNHIVRIFKIAFKSGPSKRRCKVIAVLLVFLFVAGPFIGELFMNYMYTRLRFSWDAVQYGAFTSIQVLLQVLGSILAVIVFFKILHLEETFLGLISVVGSIMSNFIFAFAPSGSYLYLGALCDTFLLAPSTAVRSLTSKIIPSHELGQVNSVIAVAESTVPMIYGPLYATVYKFTLNSFPGMYFMVSVTIRIFGLIIFIWLYKEALNIKKCSKIELQKKNEVIEENDC